MDNINIGLFVPVCSARRYLEIDGDEAVQIQFRVPCATSVPCCAMRARCSDLGSSLTFVATNCLFIAIDGGG